MLGWRLAISALVVPAVFGIFYADHRLGDSASLLFGFCLLLAARSVWEMAGLLRTRSFDLHFPTTLVCTLAVISAGWLPHLLDAQWGDMRSVGLALVAFSLSVLAIFLKNALQYREPGRSLETLGAEVLTVAYIGVLLTVTAQLRWVAGAQAGYLALGSLVIAAKAGDIGAYTLGRLFGRKKMIPRLSPGKTWMGGWGAVLGAGSAAWAWFHFATPLFNPAWSPCAWYWAVVYGVIIGVVGLIGDLCESLIKRDVGSKDSAALMPGFGGLLDLLDSVLYAGPVAYLLWNVLPMAPWQAFPLK